MQVHFYMHSCMPPARGQCLKSATSAAVQARAVCDGLPGDIVALALPLDIAKIAEAGLINPDWQARPSRCQLACSMLSGSYVNRMTLARFSGRLCKRSSAGLAPCCMCCAAR